MQDRALWLWVLTGIVYPCLLVFPFVQQLFIEQQIMQQTELAPNIHPILQMKKPTCREIS